MKDDEISQIPWDNVAELYCNYRPGPPESWYRMLDVLGLCVPQQHVLDLGTGPGQIAREFARRGAYVTGLDRSAGQIEQARRAAEKLGLDVKFHHASAEDLPQLDRPVDLVIASMCWGYFDEARVLERLLPQMLPTSRLVISRLLWLEDCIAGMLTSRVLGTLSSSAATRARPWLSAKPLIKDARLRLRAHLRYEEEIPFTLDHWVGRMLASRFLAGKPSDETASFARRLKDELSSNLGTALRIPHYIELQIYGPGVTGEG